MSGRLTAAALPIVVALTIAASRTSVTADSPFETIAVHGPSLEGNLEGDSPDRRVFVYLPPGYAKEPGRRFPVVYLLHGKAPDHLIVTHLRNGREVGKRLVCQYPQVAMYKGAGDTEDPASFACK